MSTESQPARRPLTASRILVRFVATIVGIIAGLFLFFFCADMFVGYPQYDTEYITWVGVALIIASGGVVFIIDHRRLDADD